MVAILEGKNLEHVRVEGVSPQGQKKDCRISGHSKKSSALKTALSFIEMNTFWPQNCVLVVQVSQLNMNHLTLYLIALI